MSLLSVSAGCFYWFFHFVFLLVFYLRLEIFSFSSSSMEGKWVFCGGCEMWVDYHRSGLSFKGVKFEEASGDSFDYKCRKCVRISELEAELGKCKGGWREAKGVVSEEVVEPALETENAFSVLTVEDETSHGDQAGEVFPVECVEEGVQHGKTRQTVGSSSSEGLWGKKKARGKCVLIGDSIVRYVDREFSRVDKTKRTRVCLPGARVEDISHRVNRIVEDEEVVVVEIGTNNLRSDCQDVLRSRFRELISKLQSTRAKVAICGILPRFDGRVSDRTIGGLNKWLELECEEQGVQFVDVSCFWGRRDYFARDGLHLRGVGASVLGKLVNFCVEGLLSN